MSEADGSTVTSAYSCDVEFFNVMARVDVYGGDNFKLSTQPPIPTPPTPSTDRGDFVMSSECYRADSTPTDNTVAARPAPKAWYQTGTERGTSSSGSSSWLSLLLPLPWAEEWPPRTTLPIPRRRLLVPHRLFPRCLFPRSALPCRRLLLAPHHLSQGPQLTTSPTTTLPIATPPMTTPLPLPSFIPLPMTTTIRPPITSPLTTSVLS